MASIELSGKVKKSLNVLGELRDPEIVKEVVSQLMDNALFKDSLLASLGITALHKQVKQLETRLDDMEQYSRRNCLKLRGIPEEENECTDDHVIHACNDLLGVMVTRDDISRSHRVGPKNKKYPRDIIVRFISYRTRAAVYQARFTLFRKELDSSTDSRSTPTGKRESHSADPSVNKLYINEALTKARSLVFTKALYLKKQKIISGTWTSDGRIVIREHNGDRIQVTRLDELSGFPDPPPIQRSKIRSLADRSTSDSTRP